MITCTFNPCEKNILSKRQQQRMYYNSTNPTLGHSGQDIQRKDLFSNSVLGKENSSSHSKYLVTLLFLLLTGLGGLLLFYTFV